MKVLFDHQYFEIQNFGGITRYFAEVISNLSADVHCQIGIKYSNNRYLTEKELTPVLPLIDQRQKLFNGKKFLGKGTTLKFLNKTFPSRYFDSFERNKQYSVELLKSQDFDIFHPTYYDNYFLDYIGTKPFVLTIHDMILEKLPEFFPIAYKDTFTKKELAFKAHHIIAVSENTKKDIMEIWGINSDKISVIYHGACSVPNQSLINIKLPGRYLLFVGSRDLYKNFLFFLHSVSDILVSSDLNLVCTGAPFDPDEIKLFNYLNISDRVFHCFVNDAELSFLYRNAIALVFPSLYEGFGIPIVEAFSNNCPVLLSNTSCFPEIATDAAVYFNPKSRSEIRNAVLNISSNESLRNQLIEKGLLRLDCFSWEKAALETTMVYRNLI